ncbi:MAG: hypothetical protein IKH19_04830 [Muribaculaceae bacterium]|nr:hypothetical protein [Muribaculaceae bacterium]
MTIAMKVLSTLKRLLAVVLLATVAIPPIWAARQHIRDTITYDVTSFRIDTLEDSSTGTQYVCPRIDGMSYLDEAGVPMVPRIVVSISVPFNARNFRINGDGMTYSTHLISLLPFPVQQVYHPEKGDTAVFTLPDSASYVVGRKMFPNKCVEILGEGYLFGDNHIVSIAIYPVQYCKVAAGKCFYLNHDMYIDLSYDTISNYTSSVAPIITNNSPTNNEIQQIRRIAHNNGIFPGSIMTSIPDSLKHWTHYDTIGGDFIVSTIPSVKRYTYSIIAERKDSAALRRIVALKRQKGLSAGIIPLEHIINNEYAKHGDTFYKDKQVVSNIADSAGIVREYLKYAYSGPLAFTTENNIKYAFFVGKGVPYRKAPGNIPTDWYYCDLNTDWSAFSPDSSLNNNLPIDKNPDIFIGRLLSDSCDHINNYTDKLFRYELNPGNGDYFYLRRSLYTFSPNVIFGHYLSDAIITLAPAHLVQTILTEAYQENFPTGAQVISELNYTHCGFWSTINHGSPSGILLNGTTWPYQTVWALENIRIYNGHPGGISYQVGSGLDMLQNKYYPMVSYSVSCSTMPYDKLPGFENQTLNFGESFTLGKDYGGVAYLGNTRDATPTQLTQFSGFSEQIMSGNSCVGRAEAVSKLYYHGLSNLLKHNMLGDPEFEMWTDTPNTLSNNVAVTRNNNGIDITLTDVTGDYYVAYCDGNTQSRVLSSNGSATLQNVSPNSTIMVYRHNAIPYIAPLLLQNETISDSQYVLASTVTAGSNVDSNRTAGDLVIAEGVDYEIEAKGEVRLDKGFQVEKGAIFKVIPAAW